jgi:signal transduction histidine kinase
VNDTPRELPSSAARRGSAGLLAGFAEPWDSARPLPASLRAALLARVQQRLRALDPHPLDDGAWPAGWPPPAERLAALEALAELEFEICREVLDQGGLDATTLRAVHRELAAARARIVNERDGAAQTVREALQARDRQLSVATHELRTPISSILLNLQMLERAARERGPLDTATVEKMLAIPVRQLRRLASMVGLLLDAAQVEAERLVLEPEPLDLCELVHEAVARLQELARASGCSLELGHCDPLPGLWDRLRLEQVITNLLTNAIKYGGGQVQVGTRRGNDAAIVVRDHGPGIAPEDQQRIFQPFERLTAGRHEEGAGLGLYIVREIVRAHGGRIEVDSVLGQGATFTVLLPI